jgi:hypothetical protein
MPDIYTAAPEELRAEVMRLADTLALIRRWTLTQPDTVWYDQITTLYDLCDQAINR